MIRTKPPGDKKWRLTPPPIGSPTDTRGLADIIGRMNLAARLGQQYGTDRDVYEALGYKTTIEWKDYAARYRRQDIAKAIIDRPIRMTWKGPVEIMDAAGESEEPTSLQRQWDRLFRELKLKSRFVRLDKLTGIGQYGILLMGASDAQKREDLVKPIVGTKHKLMYVKPFGENAVEIEKYDNDSSSPRYGQPTMYQLTITDTEGKDLMVMVHYTRVLHVTDSLLQSEVLGTPRLEPVYNRLMDLEKLTGGSAEMFWRGARPGYHFKLSEGFKLGTAGEEDLQDQIDEYEHKLRRMFANQGVEDIKALTAQVSDPGDHIDVQIQMISAETGIPKRILTGSERGELASSQDRTEWLSYVQTRREEFAEQQIVRPFIDWCMKYEVLPRVDSYLVNWLDLFAPSDKEKAEVGKILAEALSKYAASPMAETVVPPEAFLRYILGLKDEVIEDILKMVEAEVLTEQRETITEEEGEIIEEE